MNREKGFTLIELLAAIIVLGIISLVVFPTVNKTIKNQKQKLYDRQIATILDAAESWGLKNIDKLPTNDYDKAYVRMDVLASEGFLKNNDIKDPRNNELMVGCIEIGLENNQFNYLYVDSSSDDYATKCLNS